MKWVGHLVAGALLLVASPVGSAGLPPRAELALDAPLEASEIEHVRAVLSRSFRHFDIVTHAGIGPGFDEAGSAAHDPRATSEVERRTLSFLRECLELG